MTTTRVAVLGLGTMGAGMAANLARADHGVCGWNRTHAVAARWCAELSPEVGDAARIAATPAEAVADAAVVITCVANDGALAAIADGPEGVLSGLGAGAVWIDCGTTGLTLTTRLASECSAAGGRFLDAPITGSMLGARGGTLTFMVGGDAETLGAVRPLLDIMGRHVVHAGPRVGDGQRVKYCLNMTQSVVLQGVLEGYALARAQGLEVETLAEVFEHSAGKTGVGSFKTGYLQRRDFTPHFKLGLMHKDLSLALDAAHAAGVELPLSARVTSVYEAAVAQGLADEDFLATVKVLEHATGMPLTAAEGDDGP